MQTNNDGLKAVVLAQRTKTLSANSRATGFVSESLRFTLLEMVALRVDNPTESPLSWRYSAGAFPKTSCFQWVALASGSGRAYAEPDVEFVYMVGVYEDCRNKDDTQDSNLFVSLPKSVQVIGRIRAVDLLALHLGRVEVLTVGSSGQKNWQPVSADITQQQLATIRHIGTSEASLHYDVEKQLWIAVSMHVLEGRISLCTAHQTVEADWKCGFVADIPAPYSDLKRYTVYGAKYHPQLQPAVAGGLVLSFIPNLAGDPTAITTPEEFLTYTPKFLSVSYLDDMH